mgnify:CR=1 FL=1
MSDLFNVSTNPHVRSKDTTQTIMRDVLIALTPASIFGIYNFGLGALIRIIVGIAACVASEALYEYFMHKKIPRFWGKSRNKIEIFWRIFTLMLLSWGK